MLHPMMDSPALLWVCQPDGSGMIHNPAWCNNYGMNLMEAAEGWKHTAHHDDVPKLLESWRKSLATANSKHEQPGPHGDLLAGPPAI